MRREAPKSFAVVSILALVILAFASGALAKDKPKEPAGGKPAATPSEPVNACGCYKTSRGTCVCTDKKGKCECPGECEPAGCSEKRDKELEREMAAEVKRAQEDEKKRKAAEEAAERGAAADAGASPPAESTPPASKKPKAGAKAPAPKPPKE
jgi:hypothetical protein